MGYKISEFCPKAPILNIDKKEIPISLITLQKEILFEEKYGSLQKTFDTIEEDKTELLKVVWELLEDKSQYKNSFENFSQEMYMAKTSLTGVSASMILCLNEAVQKSMPLIRNQNRARVLRQINKIKNDGKDVCYANYYDKLASRYGYTLEDFLNLTLRQVHMLLKTINDNEHEELELKAALHGKKIKPKIEVQDISEEEEKQQDKQAEDALAELRKRYEENNKVK